MSAGYQVLLLSVCMRGVGYAGICNDFLIKLTIWNNPSMGPCTHEYSIKINSMSKLYTTKCK